MDKILFADDDKEICERAESILTREGYQVLIAFDGQGALDLTKTEKPDLVILDYLMPMLNGVEVLRALKKDSQTKDIPVIMLTAYSTEKEEGLSAGAMDFLTKPVDKTDLLLRIRSILKIKHLDNELQKMIAYIRELEKKS